MNETTVFVLASFGLIGGMAALLVAVYAHVVRPYYARYCEYCGKPLRRGEWQIVSYSRQTGRPATYRRLVWCETQTNYTTPRPPPLPAYGTVDDPDDPLFKDSHNRYTEEKR